MLQHSLDNLERIRSQRILVEQAAQLPSVLPRTTSLRLAVACEYLHRGCGFPRIFAFDLFQACLASCQNKDLSVGLYARESENFTSKARWWACPVGDPNAGKSPTCSFLSNAFQKLVHEHRELFWAIDHFCGVGNNGKIQERLRSLEGVLLLWGPEAKPILDPAFPVKESVDVGKYLDFTRWLECANGGKFEWGTGSEEKQSKSSKQHPPLLEFNPTNVNLCLFQQFTLFRRWWVKVERNHQCGFSARILMTATDRGNS